MTWFLDKSSIQIQVKVINDLSRSLSHILWRTVSLLTMKFWHYYDRTVIELVLTSSYSGLHCSSQLKGHQITGGEKILRHRSLPFKILHNSTSSGLFQLFKWHQLKSGNHSSEELRTTITKGPRAFSGGPRARTCSWILPKWLNI